MKQKIELYKKAKESYYQFEPIMSDEEFDALEDELISTGFDPTLGYIVKIDNSKKVKHNVKMLSLGKKKVLEDEMPMELAIELFDKYGAGMLSWKYDGLAMEASYRKDDTGNLKLYQISTRGDGYVGKNVTEKFKDLFINEIPNKYGVNKIDIRFECIIDNETFKEKYSDTYAHPRNLSAGIVNDENVDDERKFDLNFIILEIINPDTLQILNSDDLLVSKSFKDHKICCSASDIKIYFDECYKNRDEFSFGVDGMVYSTLNQKTYDFKGNYPTYATAIKFKPPRLISTITDIQYEHQRTNVYTPIIHFTPIVVDGRNISKASGYNFKYLVDNDLCVGKQVQIVLSNDIIPMVKPIK